MAPPPVEGAGPFLQLLRLRGTMNRQHILLVDKDPEVRALLSQMLAEAGYSVSTAHDALSALDTARKSRPDCISLDMDLPTPGRNNPLCATAPRRNIAAHSCRRA